MNLSESRVGAVVAVSDMESAKQFYEGKLGLSGSDQPDGGRRYSCGGGTELHVYPSPDNAGKSGATQVAFYVDDVEGAVEGLTANGVTFERYGEPLNTDERGIARLGDLSFAWFKDPDGNILGVGNP
jgi:catechol 2,3-dioxygenase-like lactoylglutathione lyase family enzyme